jgi:hypothetical protein
MLYVSSRELNPKKLPEKRSVLYVFLLNHKETQCLTLSHCLGHKIIPVALKVYSFQVGTKVDDYWEPGKALLQDPAKFLESLFKFDKASLQI